MNDNSPGYALAYDPEWRSVVRGYREVPEPGMDLFGGTELDSRSRRSMVLDELGDENELGTRPTWRSARRSSRSSVGPRSRRRAPTP